MRFLIWLLFKLLPWEIVSEINELSLDELDDRDCIIWEDEIKPIKIDWLEYEDFGYRGIGNVPNVLPTKR